MEKTFDAYHVWLGIPAEDQPANHYRLLGIKLFEADPDVIENAADQRTVHLRSFQLGKHADLSQRLLNEVAAAKVCLLRPERKAAYDQQLRQQLPAKAEVVARPVTARPIVRVLFKPGRSAVFGVAAVVALVSIGAVWAIVKRNVSKQTAQQPAAAVDPSARPMPTEPRPTATVNQASQIADLKSPIAHSEPVASSPKPPAAAPKPPLPKRESPITNPGPSVDNSRSQSADRGSDLPALAQPRMAAREAA
jgi:hypothetical protein